MMNENENQLVVLVHGLSADRLMMWPLARWIRSAGFETKSFGYPSSFFNLKHHGQRFSSFLDKVTSQSQWDSVHVVAHSMGGIVTREALRNGGPNNLSRIVLLGTPQKGSPAARRISRLGVGKIIKAFSELSDAPDSYVNSIPELEGYEIGSISGSYDWVIPEPSSHAANEIDHVRIFSGHNGLVIRPKAARLVIQFLEQGNFGNKGSAGAK